MGLELDMNDFALNLATGIITAVLLLGYHAWWLYRVFYKPNMTMTGWTLQARRAWIKATLAKKGGDILAVQTLRNWILAATFLATVAITISFGLMTFLTQAYNASKYDLMAPDTTRPRENVLSTIVNDPLIGWKTVIIIFWNLVGFFCFAQSIRYFNHVGFCLNVPMIGDEESDQTSIDDDFGNFRESPEHVAALLNAGNMFFTLGIRCYYLSFPVIFWYFSPFLCLGTTVLLLGAIYVADRASARISVPADPAKQFAQKMKV